MAGADRATNHDLIRALEERCTAAGFHQVVRILEALPLREDAVPVGHQGPPHREGVRFRPALDLSFGSSEIEACEIDEERVRFELTTRFFGLYGTQSPMPADLTERLLYDDPDGRLRAFLDVFNHRLLSFQHRAWAKYRRAVQYDGRGTDSSSRRMRLLCNVEELGAPLQLLGFAGALQDTPLSETSFEHVLRECLGIPLEVRSCRVRWIRTPKVHRTQLGRRNCTLGGIAPLGDEMRSATTTFQIWIGPVGEADYLAFLPNGSRRQELCRLVDRLNTDQLDCEIAIEVEPDAIRPARLGPNDAARDAASDDAEASEHGRQGLGWNTWLGADANALAPARGDSVARSLHRPA